MMTIDWNNFTPWASLTGGAVLGFAALLLILFNGRIAGISGIVGGLIKPRLHDVGWRIAFIAGLIAAPLFWQILASWQLFSDLPSTQIEANTTTLITAGLLVGIGTRYGSGCTSGHGVCGISRLSPRSLIATLSFMLAGFVTVYVLRHIWGA